VATPAEKLAKSLELLKSLQSNDGIAAIPSKNLPDNDRRRLLENGFIKKVIKGWYIPCRPDEKKGDSTSWYVSFWKFCEMYLNDRFNEAWALSPDQSLKLHVGNQTIPDQLIIRSPKARNKVTNLIHGTSILEVRAELPPSNEVIIKDGIRLFSLAAGLINATPGFFTQNQIDARTALGIVNDSSEVLHLLLEGGHSTIAGRLVGAFQNIGRDRIADEIKKTMNSAGYEIRVNDPFESKFDSEILIKKKSPAISRIYLMWDSMRETVMDHFPTPPGMPENQEKYLKEVEDVYVTDAYHSLSIEGYRVSAELINKVRSGSWNPEEDSQDREHRDAMAARGYWLAFQAVRESIKKVLNGDNPGMVVYDDHGDWYREMFAPSVTAGIIKPSDLAGYRNAPVYIQKSMHVPPAAESAREMIVELFELIKNEKEPAVRAVLGHFLFVYIHPYMDGNGRMARFLMNVMLASGGYPWTVLPVEKRDFYMKALEEASVNQNIETFAALIAHYVQEGLKGDPVAKLKT
jgi:hypothetical protein